MKVIKVVPSELPAKPNGNESYLRLAFVSDVHLGHRRTATEHIVHTLLKHVVNFKFMSTIDGLIIPGDLFDRLLQLNDDCVDYILLFIEKLFKYSIKCNVPIRILNGTPSHDWRQSKRILAIRELYGKECSLEFIDDVSIVEDKELGITIGYVPDEIHESCDVTASVFKDLLITKGLCSVDLMVMHGMFEYQIPAAAAKSTSYFKESDYYKYVNYCVVNGHDHNSKSKDIFHVPGSWERTSHNEENAKGMFVIDFNMDRKGVYDIYHVENVDAMKYITIGDVDMTDTEIRKAMDDLLSDFGKMDTITGRVRVKYSKEYDLASDIKSWNSVFSKVLVEGKALKKDNDSVQYDNSFKLISDTINIDKKNIDSIIVRELGNTSTSLINEIENITNGL